jgi:hypothetical protein
MSASDPESAPADEQRICRDCAQPFVITGGEAAWLLARGFTLPRRCVPCRRRARAVREQGWPPERT